MNETLKILKNINKRINFSARYVEPHQFQNYLVEEFALHIEKQLSFDIDRCNIIADALFNDTITDCDVCFNYTDRYFKSNKHIPLKHFNQCGGEYLNQYGREYLNSSEYGGYNANEFSYKLKLIQDCEYLIKDMVQNRILEITNKSYSGVNYKLTENFIQNNNLCL